MKVRATNILNIGRGLQTTNKERTYNPELEEREILYSSDIIPYNGCSLEDTIKVNDQDLRKNRKVYINSENRSKENFPQKGDIIIPVMNKTLEMKFVNWQENFNSENYIYSADLLILRPIEAFVDSKYLFYFFIQEDVINKIEELKGDGRIRKEVFEKLEIELPDLEQQQQLIEQMKESEAIRNKVNSEFKKYLG